MATPGRLDRNAYVCSESALYELSTVRGRTTTAREIGTVLAVTPTGALTVRSADSSVAPEGTIVSDPRGRFRGRVVRVFGPVERPYLSVRPRRPVSAEEGLALLGRRLIREGVDREAP